MKVLLLKDVYNLGRAGDIKKVADGYGRNFLLPKGLALLATVGALRQVEAIRSKANDRRQVLNSEMGGVAEQMNGLVLLFATKAGETGKLYGSITNQMIVDAIKAKVGIEVDRHQIETQPIRILGEHKARIRLTVDLNPEIKIIVHREGEGPAQPVVEKSAAVEKPVAVEKAAAVEKPVAVEKTAAVEKPVAVEKAAAVEKPVAVEKAAAVEKPVAVEKAAAVEKPVAVEKVAAVEKPVVGEKAAAVEKPVVVEKAAAVKKPVAVEKVAAVEKPVVVEKAAAVKKPVAVEKAAAVKKPVAVKKDAAVKKPVAVEKPAAKDKTK